MTGNAASELGLHCLHILKEIICQIDQFLVSLSFEDKLTKNWSVSLIISFCV